MRYLDRVNEVKIILTCLEIRLPASEYCDIDAISSFATIILVLLRIDNENNVPSENWYF